MSSASTFSSICFEQGCWFKGERKIHVADKRVKRPSSISFRVSANNSKKDIRIGLLGASGYTGAEIVRLLANHPHFGVTLMTADRKAGQTMGSVFPHLRAQVCVIASRQVGPGEQGKVQGCISGVKSFGKVVAPFAFSPLTALFLSKDASFYFPGFSLLCISLSSMIWFLQSLMTKDVPPSTLNKPINSTSGEEV